MLSSAACQKLERYAQIALAKCGVSATMAHAANEATTPIVLSPFVSSSYDNFDLVAAVAAQGSATSQPKEGVDEKNVDKGALNRSVLLSADLWRQVNTQLFATAPTQDSQTVKAITPHLPTTPSSATAVFTDGMVVAAALAVQMVQWEVEHYLLGTVPSPSISKSKSGASNVAQRCTYLHSVLALVASALTAASRDRAIESPSLTLAVATLASAAINAVLGNLLATMDALTSQSPSVPVTASLTTPFLEIAHLSLQQLRRAGAAYPLPKLFTVRVASQQLKQLGSGFINAIKDVDNVPVARMGAIGKMRLLQRMGLLYGLLREYSNLQSQRSDGLIDNTHEKNAIEQCKDAIIDVATPYVSTRTARYHIYFRTEADEQRLAMSGCTDIATQVAPIDFVLTPPMDPDAIKSMQRMHQSPAAKAAISITLQSWTGSSELIFIAFCKDGSWSSFAAEARRRILAEQAAKKSRASKKALKEEEKALQAQLKQKAVDALLKAKEEEHKEAMRLVKEANQRSNGTMTNGHDDDNDDAKSTQSAALSARSGNTASEMSKAESDVRSVMSVASFQSYATFLSVVDSEAIANEQRMQHESADGNTNLPVIFMEMACLALHQFLEAVGGSGNNAFIQRPAEAEGDAASVALDILPLNVVDAAWSAISGIFSAFAAFIDAQPRTGLICFSLSEDVQYNKGLGYQSLGLLFARVLVPALLKERACSGASEDAGAAAAIEALHVSQTLTIYERVASQAINQNLAAVLDMCCNALQPTTTATAPTSQVSNSATVATQQILQRLLVSIVSRLGQTNQLGLLLKAIITDHDAELNRRQAEEAAKKVLQEEEDEDDEDEETMAAKAAAAKAEAVDREMVLRRTVLPPTSSLRLLATPSFREAFGISVRRALDPEGLLEALGDALAQLLLGMGKEDEESDKATEEKSEEESAQAFRSLVHLRAPVLLGAASLVFQGLLPTNLVAFNIFEKCAEIEAYLLLFLESSLYPALLAANGEDSDAISGDFAKQFIQQLSLSKSAIVVHPKVKPTHLQRLFLSVAESLLVLRDTMYNVCLKDLGVDQLDKVMEVMNESLWQISELSNDSDGAAEPRFLSYDKDSSLTLQNIEASCLVPEETTSPSTGALALNVLVRLAAQRLVLVNSVGKLLAPISAESSEGHEESDNARLPPSYSTAAKALAMYVGQHVAESVTVSQRHLRLLPAEWRATAATLGPKRWSKCLTHAASGEGSVSTTSLAQHIPAELVASVASTGDLKESNSVDVKDSKWAAARYQWRRLGCVSDWETVIPALAAEIAHAHTTTKKSGNAADSASPASLLQEVLRLSPAASHAFTSSGTLAALSETAFIEAIVSSAANSSLLIQLLSAATAIAPSSQTATSTAFLASLYSYLATALDNSSTVSVLYRLLSESSYLLPSGVATNPNSAAALKAFIILGKAILKADGTANDQIIYCACLMISKHLPTYCDAADLAKLASKALQRLQDNEKNLDQHPQLLLLRCHLLAAEAGRISTQTVSSPDDVAEESSSIIALLTAANERLKATKDMSLASRPLWALAASQFLRSINNKASKEKTNNGSSVKVLASAASISGIAERISGTIISCIEGSLLRAVASHTTVEAIGRIVSELEGLSAVQRVRFTSFLPVVLAVISKVTGMVAAYGSSNQTTHCTSATIGSLVSETLHLARLPLPALLGDAAHQDATMNLLFAITHNSLLPAAAFGATMATLNAYATHRPLVLARRAALLPSLFCSLLTSIFAKLNAEEDASASSANANLLNQFNSTLAAVVRQCEFEAAVSSSTTSLTISPSATPKSFVCCAIAAAIFGTVSGRRHIGLFAKYSNELDYLAKDLVVEMLKGRLPLKAQKRLVDVTVERDKNEEKKERAKLKNKQQQESATKTAAENGREVGRKSAREDTEEVDGVEGQSDNDGAASVSSDASHTRETDEDAQAAVIALSASVAGKPAPLAVRKRYIIKRHRKEPSSTRKVSESSFADLCYATLGTSASNDAQNLLRQEIMRIRDEDGRAIFRPTN